MKNARNLTATIALTLITLAAGTATATEGVSPGAIDRVAVVNAACPTFSWGAEDGAQAYEIVGYLLPEGTERQVELSSENEVLFTRVTGSAAAWTPSAEQCFAPGGRYVWFVRAVTELIDDQVIEAGEWSAGRYFQVPAGPSADELERALEVLKQWEAANSGGEGSPAPTGTRSGGASPTLRRYDSGGAHAGSSHLKSVTTAEAAIRGEHPDTSGEVYGVVGTSASADGAGVAAANLDGGPDLVLDGETNGESDTVFTEGGIDRPSANSEVFEVKNSGPGGIQLNVGGEIAATSLNCPDCVDSAIVADGSIIDNDLADDAVTEEKIEPGAVGTTKLQNSSVTSAKIADGSVGTADLSDDAVTGAKIADGAIASSAIRTNAVTTEKIEDGTITEADISPIAVLDADTLDGLDESYFQPKVIVESFSDYTTWFELPVACSDVGSVAVDATGPGVVIVTGQAVVDPLNSSSDIQIRLAVDEAPGVCDSHTRWFHYFPAGYIVPNLSNTRVFTVPAAGQYTYYMNVVIQEGFQGGAPVTDRSIVAVFFPE